MRRMELVVLLHVDVTGTKLNASNDDDKTNARYYRKVRHELWLTIIIY
jgi:hypothetical protein